MHQAKHLASGLAALAVASLVLVGCGRSEGGLDMPRLEIRQPLNNSSVQSPEVLLQGYTDQASVMVNGQAYQTPGGQINVSYPLDIGPNEIDVSAGSRAGTTTVSLRITRE